MGQSNHARPPTLAAAGGARARLARIILGSLAQDWKQRAAAGVDPATGEVLDVRPCPACGGMGYTGVTGSTEAGSIPIPCTACLGSGQASGMAHG